MGTFVETMNSPNQARLRQSNKIRLEDSHAIKRIIEERPNNTKKAKQKQDMR